MTRSPRVAGPSGWRRKATSSSAFNNRGSNNYGSAFMKVVYKQLGKYEALDFAETARYLAKQSYVDTRRVAITGTSYGGYSVVYTMEMYPDLFPVGAANSAVGDWRLYDTIYTERYMSLLNDNLKGYVESARSSQAPEDARGTFSSSTR